MKNTKFVVGIILAVILICCICTFVSFRYIASQPFSERGPTDSENNTPNSYDQNIDYSSEDLNKMMNYVKPLGYITTSRTSQNPSRFNKTSLNTDVKSIADIQITEKPVRFVELNELILLDAALNKLVQTSWGKDGNYSAPVPFNYDDLDLNGKTLDELISLDVQRAQTLIIEPGIANILQSPKAEQEIESIMFKAYDEYIQYLSAKGVKNEYIDLLQNYVLKKEPSRLFYDREEVRFSAFNEAVKGQNDFSVRYIQLTPVGINNDMKYVIASGILGEVPTDSDEQVEYLKQVRDMTVRNITYHELTHTLSRAYEHYHTSPDKQKEKSISIHATKSLKDIDTRNNWKWESTNYGLRYDDNVQRIDESQADGIAFEILTNIYDMTDQQRDVLWSHAYGRFDPSNELFKSIKPKLENTWPQMDSKQEIGDLISDGLATNYSGGTDKANQLNSILSRTSSMPEYLGYFNPMRPEQATMFWNNLGQL